MHLLLKNEQVNKPSLICFIGEALVWDCDKLLIGNLRILF